MKQGKKLTIPKWKVPTINTLLMLGTVVGGKYYTERQLDQALPKPFTSSIRINNRKISEDAFFDNVKYEEDQWIYKDQNGKEINLYNATDYTYLGDLRYRSFLNVSPRLVVDTVYITRDSVTRAPRFSYGNLKNLENMPSMGLQNWDTVEVRYFTSADSTLNAFYQPYSCEYNCTAEHELQHFYNGKAGIKKSGQSYETKFTEICMDEISANIAQLLAQRQNFLDTQDLNRITDRFSFYRQWILSQQKPLTQKISSKEARLIAEGVFNAWKTEKFSTYEERNVKITKHTLKNADYNGCIDRPEEHTALMNKILTINDINFYSYIQGREKEFADSLLQKYRDNFNTLLETKKNKMDYMQKVGQYTQNKKEEKDKFFHYKKAQHEFNRVFKNLKKLTPDR